MQWVGGCFVLRDYPWFQRFRDLLNQSRRSVLGVEGPHYCPGLTLNWAAAS